MQASLLLILSVLASTVADDQAQVYVGEVVAVSERNLELRTRSSLVSIGFVGAPEALAELGNVEEGNEVRAVFGSTPRPDGRGRINKLLSIRRCVKGDAQCAADRRIQDAKDAESMRARELVREAMVRCRHAMEKTLGNDPRFTPEAPEISREAGAALSRRFGALTGVPRTCASKIMDDHHDAVLEACELHHCGDSVGGGCSHIAGYAMTTAALARAVSSCSP